VAKIREDAPFDQELLHRLRRDHRRRCGGQIPPRLRRVRRGRVGLGGIGLNVIQGARMVGADKIIASISTIPRRKWGRRFGMTHFVNPKKGPTAISSRSGRADRRRR